MAGFRNKLKGLRHGKSSSTSQTPSEPESIDRRRHTTDPSLLNNRQLSYQEQRTDSQATASTPLKGQLNQRGQSYGPATFNSITSVHMGDVFYHCNQDILQHRSEPEFMKAFKAALYYSTMDDRKAQLESVDAASFNWIWTDTPFSQWLQGPDGLFWISGKPASGKSTLMHHLASTRDGSEDTLSRLEQDGGRWTLIHFFFDFRVGKGIDNSPVGLLRSLLLQLISKVPRANALIEERYHHETGEDWPELEDELLSLTCDAVKAADLRVCGFIDGLDEYRGTHGDLAATLFALQENSGMKLCLASRPENELAHRFNNLPGFTMQNHNSPTIYAYLEAATSSLAQFTAFERLDPLLQKIAYLANGSILWARFAVNELAEGVLQGLTMMELDNRLNHFPLDLESVYARLWDKLTPWEKIQAGLVISVVENWASSQLSATEHVSKSLMIEDLFAIWCMTVEEMDANRTFGPEFTEMQYRLRVHAMIGNLIEFVTMSTSYRAQEVVVRLVHKSFQSFLDRSIEYQTITANLKQFMDVNVLAPKFYAQIIKAASQDLILNPNVEMTEHSRDQKRLAKDLETFKCRQLYPCRTHNPKSVARALLYLLCFKVLEEPENIDLLESATKSWLWQMCGDANHRAVLNLLPERPYQYVELFSFISHGLPTAFEHTLSEYRAEIPEWYLGLLFSFAVSLLGGAPIKGPSWASPTRQISVSPRVQQVLDGPTESFLLATLPAMPWQAHFLSLCAISGSEPLFDQISSAMIALPFDYDLKVQHSLWWQHMEMHILCCWIWSPFDVDCEITQKRRLHLLLARGVSVNDQIHQGGTAMDALFEESPLEVSRAASGTGGHSYCQYLRQYGLRPSRRLPTSCSNLDHFSLVKFQVLLDAGFDLSSQVNRASALRSAMNFHSHVKHHTSESELLKMLEAEVLPVLSQTSKAEPLGT